MLMRDEFGFLLECISFESDRCKIYSLADYSEIKTKIDKYINQDNFIEPPLASRVAFNLNGSIVEKDVKEHIAWLHRIPASHSIEMDVVADSSKEARLCDLGFVMHGLGYIYGCRLQFKDWFVDGFVQTAGGHNILVTKERLSEFLKGIESLCQEWDQERIKNFNNILFMHTRNPGYKWDWERFMMEYAVFDSIWRFVSDSKTRSNHGKRIEILCKKYNLFRPDSSIIEIVDLRNDLFHEVKWDEGGPCFTEGTKGFIHAQNLRRLNQRLICAVMGFQSTYIKTDWTSIGQFVL